MRHPPVPSTRLPVVASQVVGLRELSTPFYAHCHIALEAPMPPFLGAICWGPPIMK